jgi:hypothetical protein
VTGPAGVAVGDEALGVDAEVVAAAAVDADVDVAGADELDGPDPLLHPDASTASSGTAAAARRGRRNCVRMTAVMDLPFRLA